ncbi:N-acetylglucosamine kinase [Edaphobacter acidisoli]|uniref:N-acetylglucosamine kinase n=1 Tax=Edaphobacter acidisoli TaxID=2040573 RepID=A0A916W165_9BACT|nr:BadF/BadG/BcrA/BcrD ATPase family protein [Edaphobacter acidisoli]GGA57753.1 N-acetylglucosamine kinase [Edaphobacter acidisoli]
MAFYLGVDAGGTKTQYVLGDEQQVLGRVQGGTIKRMRADAATTTRNLDKALSELAALTGVSLRSVTRTCIGAAGITVPLVTDWMREAFGERVGGSLVLVGDVEIALDAAFFGGSGVLVLAGTGSNVAGRSVSGRVTTAGGWGPVLADQGSGHRIGVQALRDTFLALDEERSTELLPEILGLWGLADATELVAYANKIPAPDFSALAPLVASCAERGDGVARGVLSREAGELAHLALLVIGRLRREAPPEWVPEVAFTGSILERVGPVRRGIVERLERELPSVKTLPGVVDPALGALWRARVG